MKLNSKYLKELILEVIDEATRRDFLKGAAGVAGLAALGRGISSLYDDEEENPLNTNDRYKDAPLMTREDAIEMGMDPRTVDELFGPEREERQQFPLDPVDEDAWKEKPSEFTKSEGKAALDRLRTTPENLEYYHVSPAQGTAGDAYAYVDIGTIYDAADESSELAEAVLKAEGFYSDWTIKQEYNYIFGSLTFWGTYRDPDNPTNTKMAPTIDGKDYWDRDIKINLLPLAWSVSLEHWTTRFSSLVARLEQYPNKRKEILREADLTEAEYKEMYARYENVITAMGSGATVENPNYQPPEEQ